MSEIKQTLIAKAETSGFLSVQDIEAVFAALPAQPAGELVAWRSYCGGYVHTSRPEIAAEWGQDAEPLYTHPAPASDAVREALEKLFRAVCGDAGFASAVRNDSGLAYPWPALDEAEEAARNALSSAPQKDEAGEVETLRKVPKGQTPLNADLHHPLLDAFYTGIAARDSGGTNPYSGHSLEGCLHSAGWVQRDLRLALDALRSTNGEG